MVDSSNISNQKQKNQIAQKNVVSYSVMMIFQIV